MFVFPTFTFYFAYMFKYNEVLRVCKENSVQVRSKHIYHSVYSHMTNGSMLSGQLLVDWT